ncbi:hypothetical protein ElyMa_006281600 [Elysia marginata]|uniref:Uncharacterized protein n=1 Tax=Elysia marginata TaxID=1093978 RepID=A0AAV4HG10_9GAST|nr:hypothetical protein ElyMa_006281600 [Elysia marginata]
MFLVKPEDVKIKSTPPPYLPLLDAAKDNPQAPGAEGGGQCEVQVCDTLTGIVDEGDDQCEVQAYDTLTGIVDEGEDQCGVQACDTLTGIVDETARPSGCDKESKVTPNAELEKTEEVNNIRAETASSNCAYVN